MPKKVMVVDDESDIVAIIELALKNVGYLVGAFTSPGKAFAEIATNDGYGLVISDIRMSSTDGFEFARKVRKARPDIPIVLMTAFEIDRSEFSSLLSPDFVTDVIKKPFSNAQLIEIVRKHFTVTNFHQCS